MQKVESSVVGSGALSMGSSSRKMWTSSQPPVNSAKCRASHRVWYSGHTCRLSLKNASLESRFTGGYTACKSTLLYRTSETSRLRCPALGHGTEFGWYCIATLQPQRPQKKRSAPFSLMRKERRGLFTVMRVRDKGYAAQIAYEWPVAAWQASQ